MCTTHEIDDLRFVPLDEAGFLTYQSWFADDELRRRFEYPTRIWFEYLSSPKANGWLIYQVDSPVGFVQLDITDELIGYFSVTVVAPLRNRGYGRRILRAMMAHPAAQAVRRFSAGVEMDHDACRHCLLAADFTPDSAAPDHEGFIYYSLPRDIFISV